MKTSEFLENVAWEAIRISQLPTDISDAKSMEDVRNANIQEMRDKGIWHANREFKYRPYHYIIGFVPEIACARFFSDPDTKSELGYDDFQWNKISPGQYIERGDYVFRFGETELKVDLKSRQLYGQLENGWVELQDHQIKKGEKGMVDAYMFTVFDRQRGIIYLLGYMMHDEFEQMRSHYHSRQRENNIDYDSGVKFFEKGAIIHKDGRKALRDFWRFPYNKLRKFPQRIMYGDFKAAMETARQAALEYPVYLMNPSNIHEHENM